MSYLEFKHLRLIQAIVNDGSLTKAASNLFLSQSALSHQLKDLEDKLELKVFQRIHKKMILTEAGRHILHTSEKVIAEMQCLQGNLNKLKKGEKGTIRISTECYTCYHWLPKTIKEFKKNIDEVDIQIVPEATGNPLEFLKEGKLDLAISHGHRKDDFLEFSPLFVDNLVVLLSKEHPLAKAKLYEIQNFLQEHIIMYYNTPEDSRAIRDILMPLGIKPQNISAIKLTEAIVEMVDANLGVTIMAKWAIEPFLSNKNIVCLPMNHSAVARTWYIVKTKGENKLVDRFIEHIKANGL